MKYEKGRENQNKRMERRKDNKEQREVTKEIDEK